MQVISDRARLLRTVVFPGMNEAESRVLRQYIARHGAEHDEFRFNVRIGEGTKLGADASPEVTRAWEQLTKARPDTVGFKAPDRATLIEVKEAWANEAVWQLLGYRDLYRQTYPDHAIALVGVAISASVTALTLARVQGVRVFLYDLPAGAPDIDERAAERGTDGS